jgi:hypothetical protein
MPSFLLFLFPALGHSSAEQVSMLSVPDSLNSDVQFLLLLEGADSQTLSSIRLGLFHSHRHIATLNAQMKQMGK